MEVFIIFLYIVAGVLWVLAWAMIFLKAGYNDAQGQEVSRKSY